MNEMRKINLRDLEKYCHYNDINNYKVEVKYILRASFSKIEVFIMPDAICFEDDHGSCLTLQRVTDIFELQSGEYKVISDYYGHDIETIILCESV